MARIELVRFLSGNAGEALKQAQYARPELAKVLFNEAEECFGASHVGAKSTGCGDARNTGGSIMASRRADTKKPEPDRPPVKKNPEMPNVQQ